MPQSTSTLAGNPVIYAVIAVFFLVLIAVGIAFRRSSRDTSDYFRAGGMAKWWLVGTSLFMSNFSAWTFTGAASAAYHSGFSLTLMFWINVVAYIGPILATAGWMRQFRTITSPDIIRLRFGSTTEQIYSYLSVVTGPVWSALQLYTLAIFCSSILGVRVDLAIFVLGVVVLFYAAVSGVWAVLAADFVKCLVVMPISVVLAFLCLKRLGGVSAMFHRIGDLGLTAVYAPIKSPELAAQIPVATGQFTIMWFTAWTLNQVITQNSLSQANKYQSVKDGKEARMAAGLAAVLMLFGAVIWFIPPITARLLFEQQVLAMPLKNPAEGAYAVASMNLLPIGLVGVVLVAVFSATMSSLDVGLTGLAGIITQNIYPGICRRLGWQERQGAQRLRLGRAVNTCCCGLIIILAELMNSFSKGGAFGALLNLMAILGAPFVVPLFWALFIKRSPPWAALASLGCGYLTSAAINLKPSLMGGEAVSWSNQIFFILGSASLGFLFSCFFYSEKDQENVARLEEFFRLRDTPVDFQREIGEGNDARQLRVAGTFGVVMGVLVALLALVPSSRGFGMVFFSVASISGGMGALMLLASFRQKRETTQLK